MITLPFKLQKKDYPNGARRYWRNFLLPPVRNQLEICLLSTVLSVAFAATVAYAMNYQAEQFRDALLHGETNLAAMSHQLLWISCGLMFLFFVVTFITFIVFTHRIMGPTYAFRRHIQKLIEGDFSFRTSLRRKDRLVELADDLNKLSEHLASSPRQRAE
jgi:signal transduction histidine kinase